MSNTKLSPGIVSARLSEEDYSNNFSDAYPGFTNYEAKVEADRCYFCYDAPCISACPTEINIPLFIRQISTEMEEEAAKTIFDQNILGGMCARVCPTETLCEEACVREAAEGKPVKIGRLQRYATDTLMNNNVHPYYRDETNGKKIAVIGSGPAGLACSHRLAMLGYDVEIFESKSKAGGLNEYGIATYKSVDNFASKEIDWLLKIGGIKINFNKTLGKDFSIDELRKSFDAVFIGCGLQDTNKISINDSSDKLVEDAVDFIADLRQINDFSSLPIGRNVVVIGGGMTAIDAAVQSQLLGAEKVTIIYRRNLDNMSASQKEQNNATSKGVKIIANAIPTSIEKNIDIHKLKLSYTEVDTKTGQLKELDQTFSIEADQIFCAIGQKFSNLLDVFQSKKGKIMIDSDCKTSVANVWAGGDCVDKGEDLTVSAVAQGRDAAQAIHKSIILK
ncbi:MAG: NAD(P)-dependent oxidoreductase [Paracoccaceae bacterium]